MRRVACIALPLIRIEIAAAPGTEHREAVGSTSPLAVVVARPNGTVKSERDVLGNTRLDVVSREARALGVRVGQTVAAARAKCAGLRVRVVAESAVRTGLARIAEVALAFGPTTAFDVATDVVWIEVGGCAHLHGGEAQLALAIEARVRSLGHACRVAIADGPRIASAVARYAPARRGVGREPAGETIRSAPLVVPSGQGAAAMGALPVGALGLVGLDDESIVWLKDLGLRACRDLQALPRRSLGTRLGECTKDVMQLLRGDDGAPLDAWRPPEVPEERAELEWGATSVEGLGFVVRALCDRLAARLEGRAVGASRIDLVVGLDRALLGEGASPSLRALVTLPVPVVRSADLFAILRARLDHLELPAPALSVTLRALELSPAKPRPLDLLSPEPKAHALPSLVAELVADLGPSSVGTLALADRWAPEERTLLAPFAPLARAVGAETLGGVAPAIGHGASSDGSKGALEPSRLVAGRPIRGPWDPAREARLVARFEAVEWWRQAERGEREREQNSRRRDFYEVWDGASLAWVELRLGSWSVRGWID
jgi:protein ImuB